MMAFDAVCSINDDVYLEFGPPLLHLCDERMPENPKPSLDLPADSHGDDPQDLYPSQFIHTLSAVRCLHLINI